jgi:hypothetical protein
LGELNVKVSRIKVILSAATGLATAAKADHRLADAGSIRGSEKRDVEDWSFESLTGTQKERDELIKKFAEPLN